MNDGGEIPYAPAPNLADNLRAEMRVQIKNVTEDILRIREMNAELECENTALKQRVNDLLDEITAMEDK